MGQNFSTQVNTTIQSTYNSQTQILNEQCSANCTNISNNTSVIIQNSTIGGDVNLSQKCSATASCIMTGVIDAQVQSVLQNLNTQSASVSNSLMPGLNVSTNVNTTKQDLTNVLTQVVSQTCNSTSFNEQNNVTVAVLGSTVKGSLNFSQEGSTTASCVMSTTASSSIYNKLANDNQQSFKQTDAFSQIVLYIVIAIIAVAAIGLLATILRGKPACPPGGMNPQTGQPCPGGQMGSQIGAPYNPQGFSPQPQYQQPQYQQPQAQPQVYNAASNLNAIGNSARFQNGLTAIGNSPAYNRFMQRALS
jgi:hypothetical protein